MSDNSGGLYAAIESYVLRSTTALREQVAAQASVIAEQAKAIEQLKAKDFGDLYARLAAVEARGTVVMHGIDGKSVDPDEVRTMVAEAVKALPVPKDGAPGKDGTSVDMAAVAAMVKAEVAAIPKPKDGENGTDGKSIDVAEVRAMVAEAMAAIPIPKDGAPGRDGEDGKSIDLNDVAALVAERVDEAVAAIPRPKDGTNGTDGKDAEPVDVAKVVSEVLARIPIPQNGKDGASAYELAKANGFTGSALDWLASLRGKDGQDGSDGMDGVSILSAVVDADGELVLTASDGARHKAGMVRGKDGTNGSDGEPGSPGAPGRDAAAIRPLPLIEDGKSFPAGTFAFHGGGFWYAEKSTEPLNGRNPKDAGWTCAADGLASQSINLADDGRTVLIKRTTSTGMRLEERFTIPVVLDRGVYVASKQYARGDGITRTGSFYIAKVDDPKGLPGASDDWRLAVKAGKDAK